MTKITCISKLINEEPDKAKDLMILMYKTLLNVYYINEIDALGTCKVKALEVIDKIHIDTGYTKEWK